MEKFVKVKLKNGNEITCMKSELSGLRKAGLIKEDKQSGETKEFKAKAETKIAKPRIKATLRPVDIGAHSIKK